MKTESAAEAKADRMGRNAARHPIPRQGTKLRSMYDFFYARKGSPVDLAASRLTGSRDDGGRIAALRDFYGLDIRRLGPGYKHWVLAGEWFGRHYVDYIAGRLTETEVAE
jgi:hypothetical protein